MIARLQDEGSALVRAASPPGGRGRAAQRESITAPEAPHRGWRRRDTGYLICSADAHTGCKGKLMCSLITRRGRCLPGRQRCNAQLALPRQLTACTRGWHPTLHRTKQASAQAGVTAAQDIRNINPRSEGRGSWPRRAQRALGPGRRRRAEEGPALERGRGTRSGGQRGAVDPEKNKTCSLRGSCMLRVGRAHPPSANINADRA